jgi:hypothetical protein
LLQPGHDWTDLLPQDNSADGFDNVGEALHVSSFLMERYLEAVNIALDVAIANRPQPPAISKRYSLKESHQVRSTTEKVYRRSDADDRVGTGCPTPLFCPPISQLRIFLPGGTLRWQ